MSDELAVLLAGELAGHVRAGQEQSCWFSYNADYTSGRDRIPLSLTVPVAAGRYDIFDWMDGLLPTSTEVRGEWAQRYGAASINPMDMLSTPIGWDCAGAVQFCLPERLSELRSRSAQRVEMGEAELARHLESVRRGRISAAPSHWWAPFSLTGAQAKTVLCRNADKWARPEGGEPSTHILKVALPDYPDNDLVEHVCMSALRRAGIAAARTGIVHAGTERAIAVERFDRREVGGRLVRVHQEDMCQALGFPSHLKYQRDNGPSPADVASILGTSRTGSASASRFFDALVCSWLLAAPDAHAKNYSLLFDGPATVLAPLYDVCSMAPYAPRDQEVGNMRLAMRIGSAWTVREADTPQAWRECAKDVGLDPRQALDRAEELAEALPSALADVLNEMPDQITASPSVDMLGELASPLTSNWGRFSSITAEDLPGPSVPTSISQKMTRCPHIGRRTRQRCIRPYRHPGPHRYR